jgi:hypothetical protein
MNEAYNTVRNQPKCGFWVLIDHSTPLRYSNLLKEIEIPFCRKCPPVFEDQILTISLHDTRSWCYDNVPEDANHTLFDREWNIYFKNYERPVNAGPFEVFVSPKDSSLAAWEAGSKGSNLLLQKVILDFLDNLIPASL